MGYAALDFETTGLFPQKHDRVVEVGVVLLSEEGDVQSSWSTLVNPGRDVGPTDIHGISARDVLDAPAFKELVPDLFECLTGRTIVAHNLRFDLLFLHYELERAGYDVRLPFVTGLCTMQWAGRYFPSSSRRLGDCCDAAGVQLSEAHSALGDATAVAGLLAALLTRSRPPAWLPILGESRGYGWPAPLATPGGCQRLERSAVKQRRPAEWMDRISASMPRHPDARVESYLEILESALLDRYLSAYEEQSLTQMAELLGLDGARLRDVHWMYLLTLAAVAWADGVVTDVESTDLNQVAQLLGLTPTDVEAALAQAPRGMPREATSILSAGDQVCLTGQMSRPREAIEAEALAWGLFVGGLTKKTRLLVAADPDSQSGKAKKARDYGVPVITEAAFLDLLSSG